MALFSKKKELDLLNADEVAQSSKQKIVPFILTAIVIAFVIGIYVVVFITNIAAQGGLNEAKEEVSKRTVEWQKYKELATDIKDVQSKSALHTKFVTTYSSLDKKIDKLKSILPQGVYLTNLTIDNSGKTVVTGASNIPEDAYQFRDVLLSEKDVKDVLLTSVAKTGVLYTFSIDFVINTK